MDSELKQEFNKIHQQFAKIDKRFESIEGKLEEMGEALQQHITDTEKNFKVIREQMVTKDYLHGSLAAITIVHSAHVRDKGDQEYKA